MCCRWLAVKRRESRPVRVVVAVALHFLYYHHHNDLPQPTRLSSTLISICTLRIYSGWSSLGNAMARTLLSGICSAPGEREMNRHERGLVDTCFEEGQYEQGIASMDKLRVSHVKPPSCVLSMLYVKRH